MMCIIKIWYLHNHTHEFISTYVHTCFCLPFLKQKNCLEQHQIITMCQHHLYLIVNAPGETKNIIVEQCWILNRNDPWFCIRTNAYLSFYCKRPGFRGNSRWVQLYDALVGWAPKITHMSKCSDWNIEQS